MTLLAKIKYNNKVAKHEGIKIEIRGLIDIRINVNSKLKSKGLSKSKKCNLKMQKE